MSRVSTAALLRNHLQFLEIMKAQCDQLSRTTRGQHERHLLQELGRKLELMGIQLRRDLTELSEPHVARPGAAADNYSTKDGEQDHRSTS